MTQCPAEANVFVIARCNGSASSPAKLNHKRTSNRSNRSERDKTNTPPSLPRPVGQCQKTRLQSANVCQSNRTLNSPLNKAINKTRPACTGMSGSLPICNKIPPTMLTIRTSTGMGRWNAFLLGDLRQRATRYTAKHQRPVP